MTEPHRRSVVSRADDSQCDAALTLMTGSLYLLPGTKVGSGCARVASRQIFLDLAQATSQVTVYQRDITMRFQGRANKRTSVAAGLAETAIASAATCRLQDASRITPTPAVLVWPQAAGLQASRPAGNFARHASVRRGAQAPHRETGLSTPQRGSS